MIIMFQGTHNSHNHAVETAAIMAVLSASKFNRKTLLIQMTDTHTSVAEEFLVGKKKAESLIQMEVLRLEDKGIDALVRRTKTAKLVKDHFDSISEPLLKDENMLDSVSVTKKEDFELNLSIKDVSKIIKESKSVYDNIFLILNGKNTAIMQEILELADVCVTCFAQIPTKEEFNAIPLSTYQEEQPGRIKKSQRMLKVVTNYDPGSIYNAMFMKKKLGEKKIYLIPFNSGYRDACLSGTLLTFMLQNINDNPEDSNYLFIKHLNELMKGIMDKEKWDEESPEVIPLISPTENNGEALSVIRDNDFIITETTKKKGLFGKSIKTMQINFIEESEKYVDADVNEDFESTGLSKKEQRLKEKALKRQEKLNQKSQKKIERQKKIEKTFLGSSLETQNEQLNDENFEQPNDEGDSWDCPRCNIKNSGKFCNQCGTKKPEPNPVVITSQKEVPFSWICPECGEENTGKFCAECGCKIPRQLLDSLWRCVECGYDQNRGDTCLNCGKPKTWICPKCGKLNTGKFCGECGTRNR